MPPPGLSLEDEPDEMESKFVARARGIRDLEADGAAAAAPPPAAKAPLPYATGGLPEGLLDGEGGGGGGGDSSDSEDGTGGNASGSFAISEKIASEIINTSAITQRQEWLESAIW